MSITEGQTVHDSRIATLDPIGSQFKTMLMRIYSPHLTYVRLLDRQVEAARAIMREGGWILSPDGLTKGRIIEVEYDRPDDWFDRGAATMVIEKPWLKPVSVRAEWLEDAYFPRLMADPG